MAKKVRKKLEEDDEVRSFQFPEFDLPKFLDHEFEQTWATGIAFALAFVLAAMSYAIVRAVPGYLAFLPWLVGLGVLIATPYVVRSVRPLAGGYTKGDWAQLFVVEIFGWLGLWFVFLNVLPH